MEIFIRPVTLIFIGAVKLYQAIISPLMPMSCRHMPTCSQYAILALKEHGLFKGFYLSFIRILKCNPFGSSGYDPVPKKANRNT